MKKEICLTKRQAEAFELYKSGLTQEQVAVKMGISLGGVARLLKSVRKRMGDYAVLRYSKSAPFVRYQLAEGAVVQKTEEEEDRPREVHKTSLKNKPKKRIKSVKWRPI